MDYNHGELSRVHSNYINISITDIPEGRLCDTNRPFIPLALRSSCPWKIVENFDNFRLPKKIYEAKCVRQSCRSSLMSGCLHQVCSEVKHFIWARRRTAIGMEQILEPVSVGCTCTCDIFIDNFVSARTKMCS